MKTYHYRPPSKNQAHRIAFALQTASYLSKFISGELNSNEQHDYEVMAEKIVSNFAKLIDKHKTAWEQTIRAYEMYSK